MTTTRGRTSEAVKRYWTVQVLTDEQIADMYEPTKRKLIEVRRAADLDRTAATVQGLRARCDELEAAIKEFIDAEHRASVKSVTDTTASNREARHRYEFAHGALYRIAYPRDQAKSETNK